MNDHHHRHNQEESHAFCGHDIVWRYLLAKRNITRSTSAECGIEAECDIPEIRDATSITTPKTIKIRFHIALSDAGEWPRGLNRELLEDGIKIFQDDFTKLNINFEVVSIDLHRDSNFFCLPPYSGSEDWFLKAQEFKRKYARLPEMNVFAACMRPGGFGTLLGFGSFPWDPESLKAEGGVFMNSLAIGPGQRTLTHEFGHNLGLWHTFHGQSEVSCSDGCVEHVHTEDDPTADVVGDYCSDTLSAPVDFDCADPTDTSCAGEPWINSPQIYQNFMSYSPDTCMETFTVQQIKRTHCYVCTKLNSIFFFGCE